MTGLDERLQTVADAVRTGVVVADIGTDHGFLVCYLVGTEKCPRAWATDIASGPLANAVQTIESRKLSHRIQTIQTDGLAGLPLQDIDDIVIAGMGGEQIAQILTGNEQARDSAKRFILQPMSKAEELRRRICSQGFEILSETAVQSGKFVYTVLVVQYTGACVEVDDLFAWTGKLWNNAGKPTAAYLRNVVEVLTQKAQGMRVSDPESQEAALCAELSEKIASRLE